MFVFSIGTRPEWNEKRKVDFMAHIFPQAIILSILKWRGEIWTYVESELKIKRWKKKALTCVPVCYRFCQSTVLEIINDRIFRICILRKQTIFRRKANFLRICETKIPRDEQYLMVDSDILITLHTMVYLWCTQYITVFPWIMDVINITNPSVYRDFL